MERFPSLLYGPLIPAAYPHRSATHHCVLLSGCQPDTLRYRSSEGPIEPAKKQAQGASGQPSYLAASGRMNDCPITELPPTQCAHCTGAENENTFDPDVDYQTGRRYDTLLPEAQQFSALNDGPQRKSQSDKTIQSEHRRTTTTGLYPKTDLVYGGKDNQVDYLDIELDGTPTFAFGDRKSV